MGQTWQIAVWVGAVHYKAQNKKKLLQWVKYDMSSHNSIIRKLLQLSDSLGWFFGTELEMELLRIA